VPVDVAPDRVRERPPDCGASNVERPTLRVSQDGPGRATVERLGGERERWSKSTVVASAEPPTAERTSGSSIPATTCAFVTT